jgi:signal transduction histidine kinase
MDTITGVRRLLAHRRANVVATIVLAIIAVAESISYAREPSSAIVLNLLVIAQLLVTRRYPRTAALAATLVTVAILGDRMTPMTASGTAALLVVDALAVLHRGIVTGVLFAVPLALNAISPLDGSEPGAASFWPLALVAAALVVGEVLRQRRQAIEERDATQLTLAETIRRHATLEERARIARELHDIVAHHLSVISVRAETARVTSPGLSADGRTRFAEIGETARTALTEMRRLLGVLRDDSGVGTERVPQPGLDQLGELVDTARNAGTNVRLILEGSVVDLPEGVDLTAYRIVQEALTNARRHAPGADIDIELHYRPKTLQLRIRDTGPGPATDGHPAGHGLIGMCDRAAMVGGVLKYGAAAEGGFAVEAELPIAGST